MNDIDKKLDELTSLNKTVHPELKGACYICGINPNEVKQLIEKAYWDSADLVLNTRNKPDIMKKIFERIEELKK